MKIIVTGASGFVGQALVKDLNLLDQYNLSVIVRKESYRLSDSVTEICIKDLTECKDYSQFLKGADVLIHLAGRAHVMHENCSDPLAAFRSVNVDATLNLAKSAQKSGLSRFIFISSIKVNGESTVDNRPFNQSSPHSPKDPYGQSKSEAESGLRELERNGCMSVTIIRPPLIYGPGVKGNLSLLLKALRWHVPLPFHNLSKNRRSMIGIDNLIDFIKICITHDNAIGQTFLVSDGHDISTSDLIASMKRYSKSRAFLVPVPKRILTAIGRLFGVESHLDRLMGTLQLDISETTASLDWQPPHTVEHGLKKLF